MKGGTEAVQLQQPKTGGKSGEPRSFTFQGVAGLNPKGHDSAVSSWHQGDVTHLETEMRFNGFATRRAFQRLLAGRLREEIDHGEYAGRGKRPQRDFVSRAPQVLRRLWIPRKFPVASWGCLPTGQPYSMELIRYRGGRFRVHTTRSQSAPAIRRDFRYGGLGNGTNPDGLASAAVDRPAKPDPLSAGFTIDLPPALGKHPDELPMAIRRSTICQGVPEFRYARADRRDYLMGVLAQMAVPIAAILGQGLALEAWNPRQEHDSNRAFNRMSYKFPESKLSEAFSRRAGQEGSAVRLVNLTYTAATYAHKYLLPLSGTVQEAAAFVIARRERFTPTLRRRTSEFREQLLRRTDIFSAAKPQNVRSSIAPVAGSGRAQAWTFKRLAVSLREKRLLKYNGYQLSRPSARASLLGAPVG